MKIPYKLQSIKFWLAIIVLIAGTVFYLMNIGNATYSDWIRFIQWVVGIFMAANVMSKLKHKGDE